MSDELNLETGTEEYIEFLKNMLDFYHNVVRETDNEATKQFCISNINIMNAALQSQRKLIHDVVEQMK